MGYVGKIQILHDVYTHIDDYAEIYMQKPTEIDYNFRLQMRSTEPQSKVGKSWQVGTCKIRELTSASTCSEIGH